MRFTASEIAEAVGGTLVGPDVSCDGASIDTRTITAGQLFVPIVDQRDGHAYIDIALAAGAAAYLTQRDPGRGTSIVVDDTAQALTALGRAARNRHPGPVIGITGSVGKTSVKDLAKAAIGGSLVTHASERSFNNELGVPLTLLNAPEGAQVLIVEMGARGPGHIAALCDIARPTVGLVTFVGAVHTSEFGTVEAVAKAKAELVLAIPSTGTVVLNNDCLPVRDMRTMTSAPVITYGEFADVTSLDVQLDSQLRPSFDVVSFGHSNRVTLPVHGVHQVSNALAAIAAATALGVDSGAAVAGLVTATISPWRMDLKTTAAGATVINDAYNANAISSAAALRSLALLDATRRVAVLGVMAELGERHDADHQEIAALCGELGIELIAYEEGAYGVAPATSFDQVLAQLGELGANDAVLVKGSRVAGLDALADLLTNPKPDDWRAGYTGTT